MAKTQLGTVLDRLSREGITYDLVGEYLIVNSDRPYRFRITTLTTEVVDARRVLKAIQNARKKRVY